MCRPGHWMGGELKYAALDIDFYFVSAEEEEVPQPQITMYNYPNPFNPSTTISFTAEDTENAELTIYNIKGQKVKQLLSDQLSSGEHSVVWDGRDDNGNEVGTGVYFYKLSNSDEHIGKVVKIK